MVILGVLMILVGFIIFLASIVLFIIGAFKKNSKTKRNSIILGISFVFIIVGFIALPKTSDDKKSASYHEKQKAVTETLTVTEKEMDPNEDFQGYVYITGKFTGKGSVAVEDEDGNDIELSEVDSDGNFNLKVNGTLKEQSLIIKAGTKKAKVTVLPLVKDFEEKKMAEAEKNKQINEQIRQTQEENKIKKEAEEKLATEAKAEQDRIKKEADDKLAAESQAKAQAESEQKEAEKRAEEAVANAPAEYKSALKSAEYYANSMNMSRMGIYDQLTSEYGGQFSPEAGQYAIDNIQADWNANALKTAKNYQDTMAMSPEAIRDQLTSEYGSRFTPEEADYAITNLNQ